MLYKREASLYQNGYFFGKVQKGGGESKTVWIFWKSCARISAELAHAIKSKKKRVRFGRETVCADELMCLSKMSKRV